MADVINGKHNDENCEFNHREYQCTHGEDFECKYTGQPDRIQNLLRKTSVKKEENKEN